MIKSQGTRVLCTECGKVAYPLERVYAQEKPYHKGCLRCYTCKKVLTPQNYMASAASGEMHTYCSVHCPKEKFTPVSDSVLIKSALSAPKLQKAPGVQKNRRMTFQLDQNSASRLSEMIAKLEQEQAKQEAPKKPAPAVKATPASPVKKAAPPSPPQRPARANIKPVQEASQEPIVDRSSSLTLVDEAVKSIPFLNINTEVSTFWSMWRQVFPKNFHQLLFSTSLDLQELHFDIFFEKSPNVEENLKTFFKEVGAPSEELELLKELSPLGNLLGSWIDVSSAEGMDGGWHLCIQDNATQIMQKIQQGLHQPYNVILEWLQKRNLNIQSIQNIARDVGNTPPRPCHVTIHLQSGDNLELAQHAWISLGFPQIPEEFVEALEATDRSKPWHLIVSLTEEQFVRLRLRAAAPSKEITEKLMASMNGDTDTMAAFTAALKKDVPDFVEISAHFFQYLSDGFGYDVYREGFDIFFGFKI